MSYLNREQAFRVIPASGRSSGYCIYAGHRFYKPRLPLGPAAGASDNPDLLRLVEGVSELATIGTEKGDDGSAATTGWAPGSLFSFIDSCGAGGTLEEDMNFDVLVCDDMGTEIADFIGVDTAGRRVVAIHGKAFKTAKQLSASALQEVSAQALKNLGFIQPYANGTPPNLNRWRSAWRSRAGKVDSRVRRGTGTPTQLWGQIRNVLVDPQSTRRSVAHAGPGAASESLAGREPEGSAQGRSDPDALLPPSDLGRRLVCGCTPSRSVLALTDGQHTTSLEGRRSESLVGNRPPVDRPAGGAGAPGSATKVQPDLDRRPKLPMSRRRVRFILRTEQLRVNPRSCVFAGSSPEGIPRNIQTPAMRLS